ncbi:MAG: hypothetical protein HRT67_06440 [Flavobacteriaceae bacterium]|nr:hypothetical protein [Flavobacteriaceae bacterium]
MPNKLISCVVFIVLPFIALSQKSNELGEVQHRMLQDTIKRQAFDPLRPTKAAFYSAILPGLGQAYNKRYWKIPIVYAAIGTTIYFYVNNTKEYNRYRDAYKRRLAGFSDDEFWGDGDTASISSDALIRAQKTIRRNKDLSLLLTLLAYTLNIVDANVDAHLLQFNVDDNLAVKPNFQFDNFDATSNLGLSLNFKF